jgi:ATP-dependent DNA helicase RecQ
MGSHPSIKVAKVLLLGTGALPVQLKQYNCCVPSCCIRLTNFEMELQEALSKLGVSGLRGKQADAISAINSGLDVVYLFPTGTGKTLVYEACALCLEQATIVVSPLVGLLHQQSTRLGERGVGVLQAWDGKVRTVGHGDVKVIYTTPEQLADGTALRNHLRVHRVAVERLIVDEAHLVVQWDTFRCDLCCSATV